MIQVFLPVGGSEGLCDIVRLTITGEIDNPDQRICQAQRGGGVEGCKGVVKDWPKDPVHIQKLW